MFKNLNIGPPLAGGTDFRVGERAGNGDGSDQFGELLSQKSMNGDNDKSVDFKKEKPEERPKDKLNLDKNKSVKKDVQNKVDQKEVDVIDQKAEPKTDQQVRLNSQVEKKEIGTANPQHKQSREQVIQKFMDSIESEFGISSTRLVEAMKDLTPEQLRLPPEQTAELIISKLGLEQQDQDRAKAMYVSMLLTLSKIEAKPTPLMPTNDALAIGSMVASRNQLTKDRASNLNQAVDQVNQKFWTTDSKNNFVVPLDKSSENSIQKAIKELDVSSVQTESNLPSAQGPNIQLDELGVDSDSIQNLNQIPTNIPTQPQKTANPLQNLPPHLQAQLKDVSQGSSLAVMAQKIAQQQLSHLTQEDREKLNQFQDLQVHDPLFADTLKSNVGINPVEGGGQLMSDSGQFQDSMSDQSQNQQQNSDFKLGPGQQNMKNTLQKKLIEKGTNSQETLKKLEVLHQQLISGDPLSQLQPLKDSGQNFTVAGASSFVMTPVDHEKNVQQILSQAQYLVKKGGGEVKVQMTPEGLGQVQLKVELQDGKVNVHVQAESPEVKKTIESSLAELKTSLAAHKLSMEHIKVDVVNSTSTDVSAQNQNQSQTGNSGQFERDQTRQFWQQFQQNFGNQNARASLYEVGDTRNYGRRQPDPLEPMSSSSQVRHQRTIDGRGQGLNVVA